MDWTGNSYVDQFDAVVAYMAGSMAWGKWTPLPSLWTKVSYCMAYVSVENKIKSTVNLRISDSPRINAPPIGRNLK